MHKYLLPVCLLFCSLLLSQNMIAQEKDQKVIQFSGQIVLEEDGELQAVPYATVYVKGSSRGVLSDMDGFFSLAVETKDTVVFSYLGLQTINYEIPDTLLGNRYSMIILMSRDLINLPSVQIYPWPSKKHFDIEFAAMDVTDELRERAEENLAEEVLAEIREELPQDGGENYTQFLKNKQAEYYAAGQTKPMNILNPLAWSKFIKEWKSGKYKKKKK